MTTKTINDEDLTKLDALLLTITGEIHKAVDNAGFVMEQSKDEHTGEIILRLGVKETKEGKLEVVRTDVIDVKAT